MGLARQAGRLLCGARRERQAAQALLLPPVQGLCNKGSSSLFSFALLAKGRLFFIPLLHAPSAGALKGELGGSPSSQAGSPSRWWAHTWRDPHHSPTPCSAWAPAMQQHQTLSTMLWIHPSSTQSPVASPSPLRGSPHLLLSPGTNPPSPAPKLLRISWRAVSTTAILPNPFSLGRRLFCSNCQILREDEAASACSEQN